VVSKVPSGKTGIVVGEHRLHGRLSIDSTVRTRHLPQAVQDATDI
jgi:hypothetical protein